MCWPEERPGSVLVQGHATTQETGTYTTAQQQASIESKPLSELARQEGGEGKRDGKGMGSSRSSFGAAAAAPAPCTCPHESPRPCFWYYLCVSFEVKREIECLILGWGAGLVIWWGGQACFAVRWRACACVVALKRAILHTARALVSDRHNLQGWESAQLLLLHSVLASTHPSPSFPLSQHSANGIGQRHVPSSPQGAAPATTAAAEWRVSPSTFSSSPPSSSPSRPTPS